MPRGSKSKDTNKQDPTVGNIEEGSEDRGDSQKKAKRKAGAIVNKQGKGGKNPGGAGRGKSSGNSSSSSKSSSSRGGKKPGASPKRLR